MKIFKKKQKLQLEFGPFERIRYPSAAASSHETQELDHSATASRLIVVSSASIAARTTTRVILAASLTRSLRVVQSQRPESLLVRVSPLFGLAAQSIAFHSTQKR